VLEIARIGGDEDFRLFPRSDVRALLGLVAIDELAIALFGFAEALASECAHGFAAYFDES
jgi:hypothetical protein